MSNQMRHTDVHTLIQNYDAINHNRAKERIYIETSEVEPVPAKGFSLATVYACIFVIGIGFWYGVFLAAHSLYLAVKR